MQSDTPMTDDEFSDAIKQLDLLAELAEMKKQRDEARGLYLQRNYHRERLERELAAAKADLAKMREQRDEARIRVCELCARMGGVYRRINREVVECKTPEEIAEVYGWDCFKDEGGAFVFCSNCDYAISRQQMLDLASRLCPRCNRAAISEFYSIGSFTHIERRKAWIRGEIKGCPPSLPDRMPNEGGGA